MTIEFQGNLYNFYTRQNLGWTGLHRLLLGSEVTVVFLGLARNEPSGNTQMAHSQIVVVIAFSLTFDMDVVLVLHGRPLGNVGFRCHFSIAVYNHLSGSTFFLCLVIICCVLSHSLISFACVCCGFLPARGVLHPFCSGSLLFVPVLFRLLVCFLALLCWFASFGVGQ